MRIEAARQNSVAPRPVSSAARVDAFAAAKRRPHQTAALEHTARSVFAAELGRAPTPDELRDSIVWGMQLKRDGRTPAQIRDAFLFVTRMGPEWQARHVFQQELGRAPSAGELAHAVQWGRQLVASGKTVGEMREAFIFTTRLTPEWQQAHGPSTVRAQVAAWAVAQANDPNVGYSTAGRFGESTDSAGHRHFDCSGLVFAAYEQAGIHLGGNWTGAMQSTWRNWADEVPKDAGQMQPGDLILMNGHVVMYAGDGKCVGAQTSHAGFADQVRADIDVQHYLARGDAIVLRPRV